MKPPCDCTLKNCSQEKVIILVRKWVGSTSKKQMRMCGLTSSKVHNNVDKNILKLYLEFCEFKRSMTPIVKSISSSRLFISVMVPLTLAFLHIN